MPIERQAKRAEKKFRYAFAKESEEAFRVLREQTGLPQAHLLDRLIKWFLEQDEIVQLVVLRVMKPRPDLVRLILARLEELPGDVAEIKPQQRSLARRQGDNATRH